MVKGPGWHNESARHSLASRGVRTRMDARGHYHISGNKCRNCGRLNCEGGASCEIATELRNEREMTDPNDTPIDKLNPRKTEIIRDALGWGNRDARDAFYLGQNKTLLDQDIRERIRDLERRGVDTKENIAHETDELIDESYRSIVDFLDYDHMKDLFNDYMKQRFSGERVDVVTISLVHWADSAPDSFDAYVKGYKDEMFRLHNEMKIKG